MEAPGLERELQRGRRYAEGGQVTSLDVSPGRVSALVQGTRPEPYRVFLELEAHSDAHWDEIVADLVGCPGVWGALLGGRLPVQARAWRLLPVDAIELGLACSCPVQDLFCKHTAAAMYALAARAALDPFVLMAWRGRGRHALEAAVVAARQGREAVA